MRCPVVLLLATAILLTPFTLAAPSGRAAPDCITQDLAMMQSSIDIDPDVCIIVDLGILQPQDVYDVSVVILNDAIDLLLFDENGIQPYQIGQSYRPSMVLPASTESALGAYEFHWKVPPSINAKHWYLVLDNQAHDGDAGFGDQGGVRSTVSVSFDIINQAYWTPFHNLVAVPAGGYSVLLSEDDLRLDAGTILVVSAWDMEFVGDIYLQTRAMHDRYVTGAVGIQFIDGGDLQSIDTPQSFTWQVPTSLEGEELLLIVDNTDVPLGGGDGSQDLRLSVRLELAPPLTPEVEDDKAGVVSIGETVQLDASSTPNRLGQQGTFTWDFDGDVDANQDGNDANDVDGQGVSVSTSWATKGEKTIHVTMLAPSGESASATYTMTVVDTQKPIARIQTTNAIPLAGEWRVDVGQSVTFDCSSSTDDDAVSSCSWQIDGMSSGTSDSFAQTWDEVGVHFIELEVVDQSGNNATSILTLRVIDPTVPTIAPKGGTPFPTSVKVGDTISFGVDVTDAFDLASALRVHWDLQPTVDSDGNGDAQDDPDRVGLNPDITFSSAGRQDIVVTVFDASNNSKSLAFSVNVAAATTATTPIKAVFGLLAGLAILIGGGIFVFGMWQKKLALNMLMSRGLSEEEAKGHMFVIAQQGHLTLFSSAIAYAGLEHGDIQSSSQRESMKQQAEFDSIYGASSQEDQNLAFAPPTFSSSPISQANSEAAREAAALLYEDGGMRVAQQSTPAIDALSAFMDDDDHDVSQPTKTVFDEEEESAFFSPISSPQATPSAMSTQHVSKNQSLGGGIQMPSAPMSVGQSTAPSPSLQPSNIDDDAFFDGLLPTTTPHAAAQQQISTPSPATTPAPAPAALAPAAPAPAPTAPAPAPAAPAPSLVRHTCTACKAVFELDLPAGLHEALVGCPACDVDQHVRLVA